MSPLSHPDASLADQIPPVTLIASFPSASVDAFPVQHPVTLALQVAAFLAQGETCPQTCRFTLRREGALKPDQNTLRIAGKESLAGKRTATETVILC